MVKAVHNIAISIKYRNGRVCLWEKNGRAAETIFILLRVRVNLAFFSEYFQWNSIFVMGDFRASPGTSVCRQALDRETVTLQLVKQVQTWQAA